MYRKGGSMNRFERWFMKRIIRREVRQGYDHQERITEMYRMIRVACENEFTEDNLITQNVYLREWHENSLRKLTK
jgi:hypothetical protein